MTTLRLGCSATWVNLDVYQQSVSLSTIGANIDIDVYTVASVVDVNVEGPLKIATYGGQDEMSLSLVMRPTAAVLGQIRRALTPGKRTYGLSPAAKRFAYAYGIQSGDPPHVVNAFNPVDGVAQSFFPFYFEEDVYAASD